MNTVRGRGMNRMNTKGPLNRKRGYEECTLGGVGRRVDVSFQFLLFLGSFSLLSTWRHDEHKSNGREGSFWRNTNLESPQPQNRLKGSKNCEVGLYIYIWKKDMAEEGTGGDDDLEVHSLRKLLKRQLGFPIPQRYVPFSLPPMLKITERFHFFIHLLCFVCL